jgi:hypothetical protein
MEIEHLLTWPSHKERIETLRSAQGDAIALGYFEQSEESQSNFIAAYSNDTHFCRDVFDKCINQGDMMDFVKSCKKIDMHNILLL